MLSMRITGASRLASILRLSSVVLLAAAATISVGSNAARADDKPFWEQSDTVKVKKKSYKTSYKKSSVAKKYSSKSSKKFAAKSLSKSYASSNTKKLGGYAEATEPKKKKKGIKVAALDGGSYTGEESKPKKSLSGGSVSWSAPAGCLDSGLKSVIYAVAANYGPLRVNSTCRSKGHNRSVGGAPKSKHLSGDAVDFRVFGNVRAVYAYLRDSGSVGGLKHYGGGLFHIDNGPRRSW